MTVPGSLRDPQSYGLSPELSQLLITSVVDYAIFVLDPAGYVLTWNPGAERLKGYRPDEIIGKHFSSFYPAEDVQRQKPAYELEQAIKFGRVEDEGPRVRKDGSQFLAKVVITALRDPSGTLLGFAKITHDLTVRHNAEEALRRSEERLRLMIEAVGDYAIYVLDPKGIVTSWNAGAEKIKGYKADEIIGQSFARFFSPEDVRDGKPERELSLSLSQGRYEEEGYRIRKDGSRFWASVVVTPIRAPDDTLLGFAKVTRDLTARKQAENIARELVREQVARSVAESAEARVRDSEQRYRDLSRRLEVIFEGVADGITVQDSSGAVIFANSAAARTCGFASVAELLRASPEEIVARFELQDELGRPLDAQSLPARRVLRGEPPCSMVISVRDRVSGQAGFSLVRASGVPGADGKTELAVNIWHDVTEDRRREQHEKYLDQVTVALSASLDYETMLSTLAGLLVPGFADWCAIQLLEGSELKPVVIAHQEPQKAKLAYEMSRRYPPDPAQSRGVWSVLRTGVAELHEDITDALLEAGARDAEHLALLRTTGMRSVIIAPILGRNRALGAITLVAAERAGRYDARDLALAKELALRAGGALENATLYAAEKRARDRLSLLARAGEAFSSSSNYEETLRSVVESALPMLGDVAILDVVESAQVRRTAKAHGDPELTATLNETSWARAAPGETNLCALSSGESALHTQIDDAWLARVDASPAQLALLRRLLPTSLLTVPVRAQGELLGSLTVCYGKSGRQHTQDDLKLAEELARRAAFAVEQARLYAQAQEAAKRAEAANRVKDEFLATVSHELRTPLSAIMGWSAVLRTRGLDAATEKAVDTIHRNAVAQSKLIDDILDVSRIITGKLALDLRPTDVVAIARDAIEVVRPSAVAKGISIELVIASRDCVLVADPQRLQQIMWNLLSNAVKFSESGGLVTVEVRQEGARLLLSVRDTGSGIEPAFLPFVFDRFKQADSSTTRRVGGLGLGLAIVRHLVELHGGRVEAISEGAGRGAMFAVTMPVRAVSLPAQERRPSSAPPADAPVDPISERALLDMRVLVVDDEPDARELVEMVLRRAGANVETAASAEEGLAALQRFRPHVLVSDIGMPGEDGYSFMQRVRALEPALGMRVAALALSAYTREQDKERAQRSGFTMHRGKPVDPGELVRVVADMAEQAR